MLKPISPDDPYPTSDEQQKAVDTIVRMALLSGRDNAIASEVPEMLGTLQPSAGREVASVMITLAGAAMPDTHEWHSLLQLHLAGGDPDDEDRP